MIIDLESGELRMDAELGHGAAACLHLVGGVDLGLELDGLERRRFEPQRLQAVARLRTDALDLQRTRERVGIVLERHNLYRHAGIRIEQHDAALEQFR